MLRTLARGVGQSSEIVQLDADKYIELNLNPAERWPDRRALAVLSSKEDAMESANRLGSLLVGALLAAAAMTGCGEDEKPGASAAAPVTDEESAGDAVFSFNCNESRGAMATYETMAKGQARIDPGSLGSSDFALRPLAVEKGSPPEIIAHIDAWERAILANLEALRAIPPVFSGGRVIEPDTTAIDREMLQTIQPHYTALKGWVIRECGEP